jgi:AraC-like DNA-binding protein
MNIKRLLTKDILSRVIDVRDSQHRNAEFPAAFSEISFFAILYNLEYDMAVYEKNYVSYPVSSDLMMGVFFQHDTKSGIVELEKKRILLKSEPVYLGTIHEGGKGLCISFYEAYETYYVNIYYQQAHDFEQISKPDVEVDKPRELIRTEWLIHNSVAYKGGSEVIQYIILWFLICRQEHFTLLDVKCNLLMLYANIKDVIFNFYVLKHQKIKIGIEMFELINIESIDELEQWFLVWINYTLNNFMPKKKNKKLIFSDILDFMKNHILDNISLKVLANHFFVSQSYMSRYFEQVTGQTFSSYLTELKMQKALELLSNNHKVYEVAQMLGYCNVQYFRKLFKKQYAVLPSSVNAVRKCFRSADFFRRT